MDRTITRDPTFPRFLWFAGLRLAPGRMVLWPVVGLLLMAYGMKWIGRGRLKELMHAVLLGERVAPARLEPIVKAYVGRLKATGLLPMAIERVAQDRAQGCRMVMATASFAYYAAELGRQLGFDDVIATQSQYDAQGRLCSGIAGENCYGEAKLRMIEEWMNAQGLARDGMDIRFYSDHVSDRPVLEWADHAYAVNADAKMRALAAERGWPILW